MSKKNELDQYYTAPDYALTCMAEVMRRPYNGKFVEPCAGTGSFFNLMPEDNRLGMDLDPKVEGMGMISHPQDFLEYKEPFGHSLVVSNPPFGKSCSLAVEFFNHCAELGANVIAFVIPRTFRKASVINKLHPDFHLAFDESSPKNSFILDGQPYDVPCCFQIWERRIEPREKIDTNPENDYMEFVKEGEHDFVIRRVGGRAGKLAGEKYNPAADYFVKSKIDKATLKDALERIDLTVEASNSAGIRSVAKYEIVNKVVEILR